MVQNILASHVEQCFHQKTDMVVHAGQAHALKYNKTGLSQEAIDCHDCDAIFKRKLDLMEHKKVAHYKTKLCSYYHGNGWGCRFPTSCLDIHQENITPVSFYDKRSKISLAEKSQKLYSPIIFKNQE